MRTNRGWFRPGFDPRRHVFTREERSRGGQTTMRRFLCTGRWRLGWYDYCEARPRRSFDASPTKTGRR